jgi:glycosyltransferase involved in cell wall biosynthesis
LWFYNLASNFNRNRALWRAAATMNPTAFRMRTRLAEQKLQRWDGKYDMILQLHTLFAPGYRLSKRPYALVTDNTYLSSLRHWPEWVPAPTCNMRREWIELETEVYESAKFIFTWSEFTRQSFIHDYKMSPDKVVTVGGGSNLVAEDLSTKSYDSQTAIFVGYEFERKGGQYLLESWHKVRQQLPNAKLYIVGPRAPVAPPQPGVYWLGRINDREILREKYLESTCFVMPSLFEPFGHVFAEAMGLGLSCVGTNHCAMPEIINPGVTGLLAQPRDVDSLADALIAILGNPGLARTMGENAFKRVMTGGTWDDVVNRMAPHLHKIFEN